MGGYKIRKVLFTVIVSHLVKEEFGTMEEVMSHEWHLNNLPTPINGSYRKSGCFLGI